MRTTLAIMLIGLLLLAGCGGLTFRDILSGTVTSTPAAAVPRASAPGWLLYQSAGIMPVRNSFPVSSVMTVSSRATFKLVAHRGDR